ncbi:hypothetical protein HY251_20355 [bacterium]|nr:hypothetical protein [bacterium]
MTSEKRPQGREQRDPVTARRLMSALADTLDRMTARELTRFIDLLRRETRGRGRRS